MKLRSKCATAAVLAALLLTAASAAAEPVANGRIKVTGAYHVTAALSPTGQCVLYLRPGVLRVEFGKSTGLEFTFSPLRDYQNLNLADSRSVTAIFVSHRGEWVAGAIGHRSYGPGRVTLSNNELSGHLTATMHLVAGSGKVLTSAKSIHVVAHWNCVDRD